MEIEWDSRCKTEARYDWVRVFKDNDEQQTVYPERLSGSSWPGVITVDNCESLSFKFYSDGSGHEWGFKVFSFLDLKTRHSVFPEIHS